LDPEEYAITGIKGEALMVTALDAYVSQPLMSLAVSMTVYICEALNWYVVENWVDLFPSPKFHSYVVLSGSVETDVLVNTTLLLIKQVSELVEILYEAVAMAWLTFTKLVLLLVLKPSYVMSRK
jgi:glutamate mutase epsilon subunit